MAAGQERMTCSTQPPERTQPHVLCLSVQSRPTGHRMRSTALVKTMALFSSPIHMLISSLNTLTDTPRNNVLPATWASLSQSDSHIK